VEWLVVNDPQPISAAQLKIFQDWWQNDPKFSSGKGNNRNPKPLGTRTLYKKYSSSVTRHFASAIASLGALLLFISF
jgi:hypothetical protein